MMEVRGISALVLVISALTSSGSASPVICTSLTIDGFKKGCVKIDEVKGRAFQKPEKLFDDNDIYSVNDIEPEATRNKNVFQDGGALSCMTSSNKPLDDQPLAESWSRVPTTSNLQGTLSRTPLILFKRFSLNGEMEKDQLQELEQDTGKRSVHEVSAILPPWKEFCRMLGRNGCGRYMRRQLSR